MIPYEQSDRPQILLVEDDPGDQELTRRAVERHPIRAQLHVIGDGAQALDYLLRRGEHASARVPDLVLLDLNLPGVNGKRLLEAARRDARLRRTPVVVLSTSAHDHDIRESYELGCNSYVVKPLEAHEFMAALHGLFTYWFEVVALSD